MLRDNTQPRLFHFAIFMVKADRADCQRCVAEMVAVDALAEADARFTSAEALLLASQGRSSSGK